MQEALKGQPVEQFPEEIRGIKQRREEPEEDYDDEEPADEQENYYPEKNKSTVTEGSPKPAAPSNKNFFKNDMEG
jgi:hypothetical protein